mmetsp:Transcript_14846/g.34975  ORF Transcript_14846/g.34975 Transcript_14846/m.34975 type:complete len:315 (+) Transcript_14846:1208-2152(+)
MASSSSARPSIDVLWSAAVVAQSSWTVALVSSAFFRSEVATPRSLVCWAMHSEASALALLVSPSSLVRAAFSSVRDCLRSSNLCNACISDLRKDANSSSALSFMSSKTSKMLELWVLYTAAAGAPSSSSSSSESALLCTRAINFWRSVPLKETASMTAPRVVTKLCTLLPICCCNKAGFLDISLDKMPTARARVSMASMSSASDAVKVVCSSARRLVAFFMFFSQVEMSCANVAIWVSATSSSEVHLAKAASASIFCEVAVLISKPSSCSVSSHHLVYSLNAFTSASPSLVIFPSKVWRRVITFCTGLTASDAA